MADKIKFQEKLGGILELAKTHEMRLEQSEVENYFKEDSLSDAQMELVFDYLLSQKVVVKGYIKKGGQLVSNEPAGEACLSEEEEAYLLQYLKEIEEVKPLREGELEKVIEQAASGDDLAKARLIEVNLKRVVELAKEMKKPEIFLGDMIQEGNISLMLAVGQLEESGTEQETIDEEIRLGIQAVIEEQTDVLRRDKSMVKKVQDLDEKITELTEELGHKVTIDELIMYTEMSEEEIQSILKLTEEE
ncbi:hypothetical protein LJC18_01930 [Lachnospiraceae bacterium OttesenSCG-928-E19]|nr:hypothetical protein [Lachnospiraceae bacterium OttesenSCG-928-E19]